MNKAHLTAITRKTLSLPMQTLHLNSLIKGKSLDYGCGKGFDAEKLGMTKFDPYFAPERPIEKFNTITCNYVLNVIEKAVDRENVIKDIQGLLAPGGTAYISVRRDKFKEGFNSRGTYQTYVELDYPVLKEKKGSFIIYVVKKTA